MRRAVLPAVLVVIALVLAGLGWRAGRDPAGADSSRLPAVVSSAVTPVLSARRVPAWLAAPVADTRLQAALDGIVQRSPKTTCLTVSAGGRPLYERNPEQPLTPASTEKLVTAAVVLDQLGADLRFRTTVVSDAKVTDGELDGDAYLVGGGDPIVSTGDYADHFEDQPQIRTPLEDLAAKLVQAGVKRITGRVIGDESRYDSERYLATWPPRYIDQGQTGPLSALTVNDNFSEFPPRQVAGTRDRPAPDPPRFAAQRLGDLLDTRGVRVDGGFDAGKAPAGAHELAAVESPPMRDIVREMLDGSDNQTAEMLTKELGRAKGRGGTSAAGIAVIRSTAARLGLPLAGSTATDGSGLDEGNRVTCRLLTGVLDREGRRSPVREGLPVAGQSGTLAKRFLGTDAVGRLRAKTGTLNRVTALAGFADTVPGTELTFSYIAEGRAVTAELLGVQDDLVATLLRYPEGPPLTSLGPVGP